MKRKTDKQLYFYKGKIIRVVDADTIDVKVDLGFNINIKERFRVLGIDAWETRGPEREEGRKAKARAEELLPVGSDIIIESQKNKKGKYGRYLATIFILDNEGNIVDDLGKVLVKEGHAEGYL